MKAATVILLALTAYLLLGDFAQAAYRRCRRKCLEITDDLEIRLAEAETKFNRLSKKLNNLEAEGGVTFGGQSVYTRWGRKDCPEDNTLVYEGIAGGSHYTQSGGGSNYLCLPRQPQFNKTTDGLQACGSYIYGAEYELCTTNDPLSSEYLLHDNDVPCAVCEAPRPEKMMVPAKQECPTGWTEEYQGYLMTSHHAHHRTEYVCVDEAPKGEISGHENKNGALMYVVEAMCGSLPCPNYVEGYEITCVVCTK